MFGSHHCQRCDKSITHAGICNNCEISRAMQFDLAPAPKEKLMNRDGVHTGGIRMDPMPAPIYNRAPKEERMIDETLPPEWAAKKLVDGMREMGSLVAKNAAERATTLRAVYDRAFWAGIANDLSMEFAHRDALVIVRQWPAMQAELDALIGEVG